MGIKTFFRDFLDEEKTVEVNVGYGTDKQAAAVEAFALYTVIGFIADILASCEFRTYSDSKPVKNKLWHTLNILPNRNSTKAEFWQEYWQRLLLFGEALIVPRNGELIIAESFVKDEYVAFDTVFRQIQRNDFDMGALRASEVFYIKRSAGAVRTVVSSVLSGYAELIGSAADVVKNEGSNKGTLEIPALAKGKDFEEHYRRLMEEYFKTFFKNKNAVIPLHSGMKYIPVNASKGTTSSANNYKTLFDDAVKRCAQAYGVAPALVSGDVAGIDDALKLTLTTCIDPLAEAAGAMLTARNYTAEQILDKGKYIKLDTSGIEHMNVFSLAANIDKLISDGMYSIDELRLKLGDYALGEEWSSKHYITKNYEEIGAAGGETNV